MTFPRYLSVGRVRDERVFSFLFAKIFSIHAGSLELARYSASRPSTYESLIQLTLCRRIQRENRSSTFRRMGAWVDDRFAEEEVVSSNQSTGRTWRIRGHSCDGGGPLHGRPGADYRQSPNSHASTWSPASLLPLRHQFTRQLYEWPCLPLFKSRTKLDLC